MGYRILFVENDIFVTAFFILFPSLLLCIPNNILFASEPKLNRIKWPSFRRDTSPQWSPSCKIYVSDQHDEK